MAARRGGDRRSGGALPYVERTFLGCTKSAADAAGTSSAMLYDAYQAQCDVLMPLRLAADAARDFLDQSWLGFGHLPMVRGASAALNMFADTRLRHEHPGFGIERVAIEGHEVRVAEEAAA